MAESMDTSELLPDEDDRKLFVGGLPQVISTFMTLVGVGFMTKLPCIMNSVVVNHDYLQDAKQEDISAHFQTFGEIDNINIKTDPATGRSR